VALTSRVGAEEASGRHRGGTGKHVLGTVNSSDGSGGCVWETLSTSRNVLAMTTQNSAHASSILTLLDLQGLGKDLG
jgi:hypothetical protein